MIVRKAAVGSWNLAYKTEKTEEMSKAISMGEITT